jgi:hypothetical protein
MSITSKFTAMRSGIYDALFGSQSVNVGEMKEVSSHTNVKTISMTLNRQASPDDIVINAMIKKIDNQKHLVFTSAPKNFYGMIMRCFFGNKKNVERFYKRGIEMTPVQTTSDNNDFNLNVSPSNSVIAQINRTNQNKSFLPTTSLDSPNSNMNNSISNADISNSNSIKSVTDPKPAVDSHQSSFFGTPIALASLPSASRSSNDEMGLDELRNKLSQLTQEKENLQCRQVSNLKIANIEMPKHLKEKLVSIQGEIEDVKGKIEIASTWREVSDQTLDETDPAASLTPRSSVTSVDTDFNSNHPQPSSTASNDPDKSGNIDDPRALLKSIGTPEDKVGIEKIWEIAGEYREHFKRIQVLTQQRESIEKEIQSLTTPSPHEGPKERLKRTVSRTEKEKAKVKLIAEIEGLISQRDELITTFSSEYPNYRFDENGNIRDGTGKIINRL